ncbi:MAG: Ig-like domain-containing protein [Gemmatimonadota bacterium]|nr:Ig-like domain-containing protein [Gemmatimonadota bacterium]
MAVGLDPQSTEVGRTAHAVASGVDQYGQSIATGPVTWTSATPSVATVDAGGTMTALAPGTTIVTAVAGGVRATAAFTVAAFAVPPVVLRVLPGAASIVPGQATQFAAKLVTAAGDTSVAAGVAWSSSAPDVVSVTTAGLARALAPGQSVISATSGPYGGSAVVNVSAIVDTTIRVHRVAPLAGAVVGDTLRVGCLTNLARPLRKVVATIERMDTPLDTVGFGALPPGIPGWGRDISLMNLPIGVHQLVITAYALDGTIDADTTFFDREVPQTGGIVPGGGRKQVVPATPPALQPSRRPGAGRGGS